MRSAMRSGIRSTSTLGDAEREDLASAFADADTSADAAGEAGRRRTTHGVVVVVVVVVVGCGTKIVVGELDSEQPSSSEVDGVSGGLFMMMAFIMLLFLLLSAFRSVVAMFRFLAVVVVVLDIAAAAVLSLEREGPVPVRIADGRICSKPWVRATCSMLLKY